MNVLEQPPVLDAVAEVSEENEEITKALEIFEIRDKLKSKRPEGTSLNVISLSTCSNKTYTP